MQRKIVHDGQSTHTHICRKFPRVIIVFDLAQVEPRVEMQLPTRGYYAKKKTWIRRIVIAGWDRRAAMRAASKKTIDNISISTNP